MRTKYKPAPREKRLSGPGKSGFDQSCLPAFRKANTMQNHMTALHRRIMLRSISGVLLICLLLLTAPVSSRAESEHSLTDPIESIALTTDSLPLDTAQPEALAATPASARLLFTFDDGWRGQIDYALPMLTAAGFTATAYVNKRTIVGTNPSYMRLADLQTLYQAGWDIGNHTVSHDSTTETDPLTLARLTGEYLDNQNWILENIGDRGARHLCYPSGAYSPAYLPIFRGIGALTGRTIVQTNLATPVADPVEYFQLPIKSVSSTSAGSIDRTMRAITAAVDEGKTIVLMLHNVQPTVGSLITTVSDLQLIIDQVSGYVAGGRLQVMNISQWYAEQAAAVPPQPVEPPAPELIFDDTANTIGGATLLMEYRLDGLGSDREFLQWDENSFYSNDLTGEHALEIRYKAAGINPAGPVALFNFTAALDPPPPAARVIFTFDDGWKDQITNAFTILQRAGFPAVAYINRDSIIGSNPTEMRLADLKTLYAAGWDIGNHTTNHDSTTATDPETIARLTSEYLDNQTWIEQNVGLRGARHACYPSGSYMPEYIPMLRGIGALTARTTTQANIVTPVTDPDFFYQLTNKSVSSNPGSIDRTKEAIDAAVRDGTTVILMLHKVEPEPGSLITTTADFQLLVDYVSSYVNKKQLEVATMSQWYYEQTGTNQPQPEPSVYHDDIDNKVIGMSIGMEYRLDGGDWIAYEPSTFASVVLNGDHVLEVRYMASGIDPAGLIKSMVFTANEPDPNPAAPAKVLFTFDGDWRGQLEYALPMLNAAGFKATSYVMRDAALEGDPELMNTQDLRVLHQNGWDISNHTTTHNDNGALTDEATLAVLRQDYLENQQWIIDNIGSPGAWHVAYPSGKYSEPLIDILKDIGVRSARTTREENQIIPITDARDFYELPCEPFSSDPRYTDVKSVKQAVDDAVATGSTVIIFMNQVLPEYDDGNVTTADLQTVIDHVKGYSDQGLASVMTISEWYRWQISHYPVEGALPDAGIPEQPEDPNDPGDPEEPVIPGNVYFTFDRGWRSQYTAALPIMQAAGLPATAYVCRDLTLSLNSSWMRLAQLQAMKTAGWELGNMTTNYNTTGTQTTRTALRNLRKSYQDNRSWLNRYLRTAGMDHAAYPGGFYSDQLIQELSAIGVVSARTMTEGSLTAAEITDGTIDDYKLPVIDASGSVGFANAIAAIELAASEGRTVILRFERIDVSGAANAITPADFQLLVNQVQAAQDAGTVQVKTISQLQVAEAVSVTDTQIVDSQPGNTTNDQTTNTSIWQQPIWLDTSYTSLSLTIASLISNLRSLFRF